MGLRQSFRNFIGDVTRQNVDHTNKLSSTEVQSLHSRHYSTSETPSAERKAAMSNPTDAKSAANVCRYYGFVS
jgi:hypothetical protein